MQPNFYSLYLKITSQLFLDTVIHVPKICLYTFVSRKSLNKLFWDGGSNKHINDFF
jgi:hypothetical protein